MQVVMQDQARAIYHGSAHIVEEPIRCMPANSVAEEHAVRTHPKMMPDLEITLGRQSWQILEHVEASKEMTLLKCL